MEIHRGRGADAIEWAARKGGIFKNTCRTVSHSSRVPMHFPSPSSWKMPSSSGWIRLPLSAWKEEGLYGFRETFPSIYLSLFRFLLFSRYLGVRGSARIREAEELFFFFSFVQLRARCTRFDSAGWSYPLILSALLRPYHPEEKRSFLLVGRRQPRGTPLIFAAVSPPRRKRLYSFQVARDTLRGSVSARRLSAEADKKREREKKTANREVWEDTTKGRVLDN